MNKIEYFWLAWIQNQDYIFKRIWIYHNFPNDREKNQHFISIFNSHCIQIATFKFDWNL